MVKISGRLLFVGCLLLALLGWTALKWHNHFSALAEAGALITIPIFLLIGMAIGYCFARQHYFGQPLMPEQLKDGKYVGIKLTERLIDIKSAKEAGFRLLWVDDNPAINRIPLRISFSLNVSTTTGKKIRSGREFDEWATKRVLDFNWRDPNQGKSLEDKWIVET